MHDHTYHHATDIKPSNILTEIKESWIISRYLQDVPSTQALEKLGHQIPIPTTFMKPPKNYISTDIRLADFGQARRNSEQNTDQVQPESLRAPEVILKMKWDSKIDIWSVACVVNLDHHHIDGVLMDLTSRLDMGVIRAEDLV